MGDLRKAGVKRQTNTDENGGGECHWNKEDNYRGQGEKKREETYLICSKLKKKTGVLVIYELITALRIKPKLL